jgi:hypothetical protein
MESTYESICKQIGNNWGHKSLFSLGAAPQTLRCSWDDIRAKAPVREEDVTRFCVAVVSNKVDRVQHNTVTPVQGASGAHPAPESEQASAVALTTSSPRPWNPRAPIPAPTPQNPLRRLPSHLLPRHVLPRPSALTIHVPHPHLPHVQTISTLTVYHTPSSSAGASVPWHSRRSAILHLWLRTCTRWRVWHATGRVYPPPQIHGTSRTRRSRPPVLPPRSPTRCTPLPGKTRPSPVHGAAYAACTRARVREGGVDVRAGGRARTPACTRHPCTGRGRGKGRRRRRRRRRRRPVERRAQPAAHCDARVEGRGRRVRVPAHACTRTRSLRECEYERCRRVPAAGVAV